MTACSACGTEPLPSAPFCHGCGSPVGPSEGVAEYKQVTVLFADVVHSMDIAAAVGAERLREIMKALVQQATTAVQRYSGTVDKFTGDGIMAVFGAPVALEDHAFRACLAALDLQMQAEQLALDVKARDGVDLKLRVGLNSGEVIAGEIGSGAGAYTAIGEQVGMAQRMESAAPSGGVMLSESTARLVDEAVELADPELVHIKGSDQPVPARRLLGIAEHAAIGRRDTTLVGRQWELAALTGVLDRSIAGTGSVVGLVAPPGVGKSRLSPNWQQSRAIAGYRCTRRFASRMPRRSRSTRCPGYFVARSACRAHRRGGLRPHPGRDPGCRWRGPGSAGRPAGYPRSVGSVAGYRAGGPQATAHGSG